MAVAVKAKGFLLFPGIAGKCSLPMAGSPASGAERGLGCPLPRWSSLCRVRVGARSHSAGNQYYTSHLLVLPLLFYLLIHSLLFYFDTGSCKHTVHSRLPWTMKQSSCLSLLDQH